MDRTILAEIGVKILVKSDRILDLMNRLAEGRMSCVYEKNSDVQVGSNSFFFVFVFFILS